MRTPATASIVPFRTAATSFDRRPLPRFFGQLTCIVLVKHQERDKALFVSDDGDVVGGVWLPKAMLVIDAKDRGPFLVVTISQAFAAQKRLSLRFIDPRQFCDTERDMLAEAVATAARTRLRLRGFQQPLAYPGRNAFA